MKFSDTQHIKNLVTKAAGALLLLFCLVYTTEGFAQGAGVGNGYHAFVMAPFSPNAEGAAVSASNDHATTTGEVAQTEDTSAKTANHSADAGHATTEGHEMQATETGHGTSHGEGHGDAHGSHGDPNAPYDAAATINHHISDAHSWHFFGSVELHLPVIAYRPGKGLSVFSSSNLAHGAEYDGLVLEHEKLHTTDGSTVYDFSITKNVASMLISAVLLVFVFLSVAKGYETNKGKAPKGIQSLFETIIVFIRDDVARPSLGKKYAKYMPYLLTVFFFIWFNNLLGLIPGGANLTGNISLTMLLALFTFIVTQVSGTSTYWGHIFWMPGVPVVLKPILAVIEFIGIFTKPFALMIRLFANIFAGHIIILSLLGLTFMFKSFGVGIIATVGASIMMILEFLVAVIQAYIFTMLSAVFIGQALEEHHHEEGHDHAAAH